MSYVYGIQCGEFIKIGVAQNVAVRLKTLELYNPHPCAVVLRRAPPEPYYVEKRIHALMKASHVKREWFKITPEEARQAYAVALVEVKQRARERREAQIVAIANAGGIEAELKRAGLSP